MKKINKLKRSNILFDKDAHVYTNEQGVRLIGVTTLLAKHGISADISFIPKRILSAAANKGTIVHKQIEDFDNTGVLPTHEWAIPYTTLKLDVLESEFLVSYKDIVATHIDKILSDFSVCDIKTSSKVDIQGVTWQCSLGAYMLEKQCKIEVPKLYCIHLREGKSNVIELERVPNKEIEELLSCEKAGIKYNLVDTKEKALMLPIELVEKTKEVYRKVAMANELKKLLDKEIANYMQDNNIYSAKADGITFTWVKPSTSKTFDKTKFQEAYPNINLSDFDKITEKKGYLRTTIKEIDIF